MPTNEQAKVSKAHRKEVDYAQEMILDEMFEDLRINYDYHFSKKIELEKE